MDTKQKTVLITGANKGIGFEIARQLGLLGFQVILSGRDRVRVSEAVDRLAKNKINVVPLVMDVGEVSSIRKAFESIRKTIKALDI